MKRLSPPQGIICSVGFIDSQENPLPPFPTEGKQFENGSENLIIWGKMKTFAKNTLCCNLSNVFLQLGAFNRRLQGWVYYIHCAIYLLHHLSKTFF